MSTRNRERAVRKERPNSLNAGLTIFLALALAALLASCAKVETEPSKLVMPDAAYVLVDQKELPVQAEDLAAIKAAIEGAKYRGLVIATPGSIVILQLEGTKAAYKTDGRLMALGGTDEYYELAADIGEILARYGAGGR